MHMMYLAIAYIIFKSLILKKKKLLENNTNCFTYARKFLKLYLCFKQATAVKILPKILLFSVID